MSERARILAKKPEAKKEASVSRTRKTDLSQSMKSPADRVLFLQRTIGNQAVQRLMKSGALQTKLAIGKPGDIYEQEADRVAEQVMRMPEPGVQRQVEPEEEEEETLQAKPLAGQITPLVQVQRQEEPEEEEETLQAKPLAEEITPLVQRQVEPEEEELQMKVDPAVIQRQEPEEEELLQGKMTEAIQKQPEPEEEELMQGKFASGLADTLQTKPEASQNNTGMPDHLKSGLENLSSMNLSSVRVHHNSSKPAQLNALAYTQGQDIHVGPGQEKHLPHEGWHAVQQMQGRVQPTKQSKGVSINDDAGLEREADVMGANALQMKGAEQATMGSADQGLTSLQGELAPRSSPPQHQSSAVSVQRREETEKKEKVPFTLASLDNTWHQVVNNFVNWAMRGLELAKLPENAPGKVFTRGLAYDFAWIAVGLAANFAGGIGAPAVAMAKSLIERKKEEVMLWTALKFSAIKTVIRKRLTRLSVSWKKPAVKWPALKRVLSALGPDADMNSKADVDRRRRLIRDELTGRSNDTDLDVSNRIRQDVQDRWAYFKETIAFQKRRVREARRKEGYVHWIARGFSGTGYWDKDDESPGLNIGDAMKMPKGYVPPSRRQPAFRRPR